MQYYNSIIETLGNTPLVKLNKVTQGIKATVLAKVEYLNSGNSMKDRMALKMVEMAEKSGQLKPGGTIIEGTSGNTGMGLALTAIARGYKCIFTVSDKQSKEKIDILRAVGAEVIVCPTNVAPDDPRSYYSVAKKLNQEIPNSFYPNQYDNPGNALAHYETTGPEIWRQTEGKITHYAAGVGTGGSMCGTAKFLKEQNPNITTIGIDTYGSVFKKYKETGFFDPNEIFPYLTEGIGEDILPQNVDFKMIDHFVKVTDKDSAIMTRRLAKEEGLFVGWSCGSAVFGALEYAREHLTEKDVLVIILPDHGTRYINKIYNDDWMRDRGFIEHRQYATAADIISKRTDNQVLCAATPEMKISQAIKMLHDFGISQMPVFDKEQLVGSFSESEVLQKIIETPEIKDQPVSQIMGAPFIFVGIDNTVDVLASLMKNNKQKAVLVRHGSQTHIITQADLLAMMNI